MLAIVAGALAAVAAYLEHGRSSTVPRADVRTLRNGRHGPDIYTVTTKDGAVHRFTDLGLNGAPRWGAGRDRLRAVLLGRARRRLAHERRRQRRAPAHQHGRGHLPGRVVGRRLAPAGRLSRDAQRPPVRGRCRDGQGAGSDPVRRRPVPPAAVARRLHRARLDRLRRDGLAVRPARDDPVRRRPSACDRPRALRGDLELLGHGSRPVGTAPMRKVPVKVSPTAGVPQL